MSDTMVSSHAFRVADLRQNRETHFALRPNGDELAQIAAELGLDGLRKLAFAGHISAEGRDGWRLDATLGATVTQPCIVTLDPVVTRIDEDVVRRFVKDLPDATGQEEVELPDDESLEELGSFIDPWLVMVEALALALPLYPRKDGAELGEAVFTAPGEKPMLDEDTKPFAGLADLRDKLSKDQ